jgi:hypothetical protein
VTTNVFTVPAGTTHWDLAWSYDCPGAVVQGVSAIYNFAAAVFEGDQGDSKDAPVTGTAASDNGTESYSDSGVFSLHVGAQEGCTWSVKAIIPNA